MEKLIPLAQVEQLIDEMIQVYKSDKKITDEYKDIGVEVLQEARDKISSLPSDTQWIDLDTMLPKERQEVLFSSKGTTKVGYYVKSKEGNTEFWYSGGGYYAGKITHWMPLPLPPNN